VTTAESLFQAFLNRHDDAAWAEVLDRLTPSIHPVDRRAVGIWFAFFPLRLHNALATASDPSAMARALSLAGKYRLADQVDSSHEFLYGHRYWPEVKREVNSYLSGSPASLKLDDQIVESATRTSKRINADVSLLVGITAVAFMTLQQAGPDVFSRTAEARSYGARWKKSPDQIVAGRIRDAGQGLFGFLRTIDKRFTVTFREYEPGSTFEVINDQELTTASARDQRDYRLQDQRCIEGPIPVECRTAACGTCWVGILSDTRRLSEPTPREVRKMADFGYSGFTGDGSSPIRLACQTRSHGNVSIVIPPWNGLLERLDEQSQPPNPIEETNQ
jgi:ferredoxin